jgi:hypothetical protein
VSERGRIRLPLASAEPDEIPPVDDALRLPFAAPSIALVAIDPAAYDAALAMLRSAANQASRRSAEVHAVLAPRESARVVPPRVEAALLDMPEALMAAERALGAHDLVLATGAAVVAIRRPTVALLLTSGRPASDWPADVRSVRHRFDLIVPELDAVLARELIARI